MFNELGEFCPCNQILVYFLKFLSFLLISNSYRLVMFKYRFLKNLSICHVDLSLYQDNF